jgi:hypothetical protein
MLFLRKPAEKRGENDGIRIRVRTESFIPMTGSSWFDARTDDLLDYLIQRSLVSDRQLRLMACWTVRLGFHHLGKNGPMCLKVVERVADSGRGLASLDHWRGAAQTDRWARYQFVNDAIEDAIWLTRTLLFSACDRNAKAAAMNTGPPPSVIRDVVRCPFWKALPPFSATPDVKRLANTAYSDREADGQLRWDILGVLSDAAEDAGCVQEVLDALRSENRPVFRGFWPLDYVGGFAARK